jgi:curved DNA-binding protein CbpA
VRPLSEQNYYDALDVSPEATLQEIERAYWIARSTYQPDSIATYSVFSEQENAEILRRVEEAFAVLSDARLRREYDARLRRESFGEGLPARVAPPDRPHEEEAAAEPLEAPTAVPTAAPAAATPDPPARRATKLTLDTTLDGSLEPEDGVFDGPVLRRIRMSRGVELEEIAFVTKISQLYLRFLEENRYHDLPAQVYVRGFVREYAKCLRLDPAQVTDTYMKRFQGGAAPQGRRA